MLDTRLIIELAIYALSILILVLVIRRYTWNSKMSKALIYQYDHIAYGQGNAVVGLAMIANALKRSDRDLAIHHLLRLATLDNNPEALFALQDHISSRVLRRVLKTWHANNPIQDLLGRGDLKPIIEGGTVGQLQGKKLVCFAVGTRTIEHLCSDLTRDEHAMLRDRFGIHQPLEVIRPSATS